MEQIFKSITYIEENMFEAISIHDIAKASNYSTYHFCRIFRSIVGDSPKEYLRKRRLTIAAERLIAEKTWILDIALDCQFKSHGAFTRSFKQFFKMTPEQFRAKADPVRLTYKNRFSLQMLNHLQKRLNMEPEIIIQPETKVIGVSNSYQEEDLDIETLWSAFRPYVSQITNRVGTDAFGIYEEYSETETGVGFTYICSIEVSDFDSVPKGMISRIIPEQMYVVFRHEGSLAFLPETLRYIWGSWLPKSKYQYTETPDFELYASKAPETSEKILFLYIPVKS